MFSFDQEKDSTDPSPKDLAVQVFLKYYNYVRSVAWRTAPSTFLLDDVAHDVFIEFVKNAEKWNFEGDLRPLLAKITQNIALVHWRKYLRNLPENLRQLGEYLRLDQEKEERFSSENDLEDRLTLLKQCLKKLPEKSRELVESYYNGIQNCSELAQTQDKSCGAIYMAMSRIRSTLKTCIERKMKTEYENG